jgi:NTP pyrophosphatase (non-canonical NTP hydrolase)
MLIKEAGDLLWYIAQMATALDIPLSVIAERNIAKLEARYPDGFDSQRSINREA